MLANAFTWLASHGGGSSLGINVSPDGLRGLCTTSAAEPGDVLLEVPLAACLSASLRSTNDEAGTVQPPACVEGMDWTVQLACSLLAQRQASTGESYLDAWTEAPPLPFFCDGDTERDEVLASGVDDRRVFASEQLDLVRAAAAEQDDTALAEALSVPADFDEALAIVWSRAFRIRAPRPIGSHYLLIPVVDLANHEERPSAVYAASPKNGGVIRLHAARRLSPGAAVTISYGEGDDAHFVEQYGFVPHSNRLNAVSLPLSTILQSAEPPAGSGADGPGDGNGDVDLGGAWSAERLREMGVEDDGAQLLAMNAAAPSKELTATLRLLLTGQSIGTLQGVDWANGEWDGGRAGGFDEGDEAGAEATLRCVSRAATREAARIVEATPELDNPTEAGAVLLALRRSRLRLLESLSASADRLAGGFAQSRAAEGGGGGGGASMAARMALEAAMMEAEPRPYPFSPKQMESFAAREWDWEASRYGSSV